MRFMQRVSWEKMWGWLRFCLYAMAVVSSGHAVGSVIASPGQIDLSQSNWQRGEVYRLDGLWRFYPGVLTTPAKAGDESSSAQPGFMQVPGLWNASPYQLPVNGFATFALRVKVPERLSRVYLAVPDMPSAYRLWVNGKEVAHNGRVGQSEQQEEPAFGPKVVVLAVTGGQLDLHLQVSNYHYKEGGVWHSFRLAGEDGQTALRERPLLLDLYMVGVLSTIGMYLLSVFWLRRQERAALFFGLFCLAVAARALLVGERILYQFDALSWANLQRLEHVLFFICVPLFASFYRALYPAYTHRWPEQLCWGGALIASLLTLILPVALFSQFSLVFQGLILLVLAYVLVTFLRIAVKREAGSTLFGLSLLLLIGATLIDLLATHFVLQSRPSIHWGIIGFVVTLAFALNKRYVHSLNLVEAMSEELRQRNSELESLDAYKDEFLAVTSHELRTPLHAISGLAQSILSQERTELSPALVQNIDLIAASSQRLGNLVNDILDYSAIKHGELTLQRSPVDIRVLAQHVLASLEPLLTGKDVVLSAEIAANVQWVMADANRLQQILFNLIGNAVKFTEEGFVLLKISHPNETVLVEVIDTGIGIPESEQHLLLQPFKQFSQSANKGTGGLGLMITRQLVEQHGSPLWIESKENLGTQVRFRLPPAASEDSGDARPAELEAAGSCEPVGVESTFYNARVQVDDAAWANTSHYRVFVVDDEEINRQLLRTQLQQAGYQTDVFAGGASLLERLNEDQPDVVLLDLMMPGMNGFEVCTRIRERYSDAELPVLMLTARHQKEDIVTALNCGANDYLTKPYQVSELVARVNSQLRVRDSWRQREENRQLQREIDKRKQTEKELQQNQQRLRQLLDLSDTGLMLLDDALTLCYANAKAAALAGGLGVDDAGRRETTSVQPDFTDACVLVLQTCLRDEQADSARIRLEFSGNKPPRNALVHRLQGGDRHFLILVLDEDTSDPNSPLGVIKNLANELGESRQKITALESALLLLAEQWSTASDLPEKGVDFVLDPTPPETLLANQMTSATEIREAMVELMRTSLNLWERYSGKGKIQLAEESRCWRVYVDGSTVKTRTLDKYLSLKTLPENPRWRLVTRTANFVMAQCELPEAERGHIQRMMADIEQAMN
ncbi:MAG: response regulator [Hahellaceae bacterium]|nr:response regulator [Hahellaceae bacterium]